MDEALVQIAIGLFFVSWIWAFPRWLVSVRKRVADKGAVANFDSRIGRTVIVIGRYGVPGLGMVLIISGVAFLIVGN